MSVPPASPSEARRAAALIVQVLRESGHTAYLAGGCVRDELLGLEPSDFDVATDALPDRVGQLFNNANLVGKSFGVVIVRLARAEGFEPGVVTEVATFRSEGAYSDARRPDSVSFTDAETDAARRDFTINALFLDPTKPADAPDRVIDFVGGQQDLSAKQIRAVGDPDARLAEDHLRALRAVRFAARLGFEIEQDTARAITTHASSLRGVSTERVGGELRRMLAHPSRADAARWLDQLELTESILGPCEAAGERWLTKLPESASLIAALAAWVAALIPEASPPEASSRLTDSLALSNVHAVGVREALEGSRVLLQPDWLNNRVARQKRDASAAWFQDALALVQAQAPDQSAAIERRVNELAASANGLAPAPWITGDDLIKLGAKPGPQFKDILARIYDAQLECTTVRTPADATQMATDLIGS